VSRLHPRIVRDKLMQEQARALAGALEVTGQSLRGRRSAEADPGRLGGLPAIGPNVTGAIPGTVPHRDDFSRAGRRR